MEKRKRSCNQLDYQIVRNLFVYFNVRNLYFFYLQTEKFPILSEQIIAKKIFSNHPGDDIEKYPKKRVHC